MEIGIISDTHGYLDPNVFRVFDDCDEIWHAGASGSFEVLDQLSEFKPLKAVYGNIDDSVIRSRTALDQRFVCENVRVWMTHIGGHPGKYAPRIREQFRHDAPDIFICGHSHVVSVENDHKHGLKYLNPGAAGHEGQHLMRTVLKATFSAGEISNLRLIELGSRGRISSTHDSNPHF
jgi:putative phosphoesterase